MMDETIREANGDEARDYAAESLRDSLAECSDEALIRLRNACERELRRRPTDIPPLTDVERKRMREQIGELKREEMTRAERHGHTFAAGLLDADGDPARWEVSARVEFEMTEDQFSALLAACKPVPAMFLSGGEPMFGTPQENANRAWATLGAELGFEPMTVQPVAGNQRRFTAVFSDDAVDRMLRGGT